MGVRDDKTFLGNNYVYKLRKLTEEIPRLLAFVGKVLGVVLLYDIACFLVFRNLPPATFSTLWVVLLFSEGIFFIVLGGILSTSYFFSTIERHKYRRVALAYWGLWKITEKKLTLRERRYALLRAITLVVIGLLFLFWSLCF